MKERLSARLDAFRWKRQERLLGERFDVLTVCSEADRRSLSVTAPVHVIPSGFERSLRSVQRNPAMPTRFGFIGLFDYAPNAEGVRWFIKECWPMVKSKLPEARLRLVGRGSENGYAASGPDVDGLGWVEDSDSEIASWTAMIVPLHVGGGTRVKIAEGFSRKCPIASTSLGAFGYEVNDGRDLLLANDPLDFANACVRLAAEPAAATQLAERAYSLYLERWTWDAIAPRIWNAAEDCLRLKKDRGT
jgi:glycosyltransferase involved in cell wall biosynthesis